MLTERNRWQQAVEATGRRCLPGFPDTSCDMTEHGGRPEVRSVTTRCALSSVPMVSVDELGPYNLRFDSATLGVGVH